MTPFTELYRKLIAETIDGKNMDELEKTYKDKYDSNQLDCLLHPEKHPLVWQFGECTCPPEERACVKNCPFDAIKPDADGNIKISAENCVGCSTCIDHCRGQKLTTSRDIIPALKAVRGSAGLTYALVAPAFLGQFSEEVTPGKLRTALKQIGFDGMLTIFCGNRFSSIILFASLFFAVLFGLLVFFPIAITPKYQFQNPFVHLGQFVFFSVFSC